jgi:hypothetical protein
MSDAGKTCVALMVSAAKAGAPSTQASAAQIPLSIFVSSRCLNLSGHLTIAQ